MFQIEHKPERIIALCLTSSVCLLLLTCLVNRMRTASTWKIWNWEVRLIFAEVCFIIYFLHQAVSLIVEPLQFIAEDNHLEHYYREDILESIEQFCNQFGGIVWMFASLYRFQRVHLIKKESFYGKILTLIRIISTLLAIWVFTFGMVSRLNRINGSNLEIYPKLESINSAAFSIWYGGIHFLLSVNLTWTTWNSAPKVKEIRKGKLIEQANPQLRINILIVFIILITLGVFEIFLELPGSSSAYKFMSASLTGIHVFISFNWLELIRQAMPTWAIGFPSSNIDLAGTNIIKTRKSSEVGLFSIESLNGSIGDVNQFSRKGSLTPSDYVKTRQNSLSNNDQRKGSIDHVMVSKLVAKVVIPEEVDDASQYP